MISVLDSCSLIAYLQKEPGTEVVERLLADESMPCFVHSLNLCEVYYDLIRRSDVSTARQGIDDLLTAGVVERADFDRELWERAGEFKARGGIALPDCVCIALALRVQGQVVTSDHREFDPIAQAGLCPVLFFR